MKHFAIRTVRNGTVRIHGRTYRPEAKHLAYDGRLDGQRFAFGLYLKRPDMVCLWGTEAAFRGHPDPTNVISADDGPEVVDGTFPWSFWHAEATA